LTEATSIALVEQIKFHPIMTNLGEQTITTSYVQQGVGGTPIVLLHGFDSSLLEFRRLLPLLAFQQETWAIDLLGFGFTERIPQLNFTRKAISSHLYCFWQTLIKQPVVLVGASMGGAAAIDFTLSYPQSVSKLVLIDSAGMTQGPPVGRFLFPPLGYLATSFLSNPKVRQQISLNAYYDKSLASLDAQICARLHLGMPFWREALISFTKSGGYQSFGEKPREIERPTLILWGEHDEILGTKDGEKFAQTIPKSKLIWIRECGHVPHLEKPEITAQHILNFR
jgi:pimeloyl-ACP methyl ester carboxylesterase